MNRFCCKISMLDNVKYLTFCAVFRKSWYKMTAEYAKVDEDYI